MSGTYFSQLIATLPNVIANMDQEFDSHAFIGELVKQQPHLYINTLFHEYMSKSEPFRLLHSDLARELAKMNSLVRQQNTKEASHNIHFRKTNVEKWNRP